MSRIKLFVCFLFALINLNTPVLAVSCPEGGSANSLVECNIPSTSDTEGSVIRSIINFLIAVAGVVCVVVIVYSGFLFATTQGDQAKVQRAIKSVVFAVAGLIIAILAYAIVNFVLKEVF